MNQALRHLRIADLELFITAAHLKNLGKAALIHNLSQSAASASIMRVEIAFGYPLCTHEKRQFRLTHEGTSLVPRAEEWLKQFRETVMKEQVRAAKSRAKGEKHIEQRKWPTIVSDAKARRAAETSGRKKKAINHNKQDLIDQLSELRLPEILKPKFSLEVSGVGSKALVFIQEGACGYDELILQNIYLSVGAQDRMAIRGDNGSGKTTLIKAILNDPSVTKSGDWYVPNREDIGYLDQHYGTLDPHKTALETIHDLVPTWTHGDIRRHLNDFLFRKNEEVNALIKTLSGGEKARLTLAQIAAKTPKLLILDEITNNLDLETRAHVIQVLKDYPGAMMVISHDEDFLKAIQITNFYNINQVLENE